MKKIYTYPTIEILPFCAVNALCASGDSSTDIHVGPGGNSWNDSRAPDRTPSF